MFCSRHAGDADDGQYVETDPTGRYGRFEAVLGKGAMKIVYRAFDVLEGMEVAWNQARIRDVLRSPEALERLYSEVHLLSTLQHDSIIQFLASWVDGEKGTFNFITEMFTSGTLREYRQRHKRVNMRAVKNWARQILHGLVYLHNHKPPVIHRDLKCDNIFINGHLGQVKIGDLGLAAILRGSQQAHSIIGTPEFMAPEMYDEEYNELVDVYSFGMCMLEIITGEHPYNECSNPAQIYKKVTSGKLPGAFHRLQDPEAKRFVGMCLEKASWRPSARDLLLDPFLADEEEAGLPGFQGGLLHGGSLENRSIVRSKRVLEQEKSVNGDMKITGKLNPDDDTIFLRVQISDNHGHPRNIYFPFDILHDTPASVAHEMVGELDIEGPGTWQITEMINQEISALVPGWKEQADHYHNQHAYSYQEDDDHSGHHPVHYTSSSPSSRESRDFSSHNWLQDTYPDDDDDATSETSINSGKYSSISCSDDCKQECKTISPMQDVVASPQSQRSSKLRIEESSRIERRNEQPLRLRNNKQSSVALEPPPTSNRIEKNSPRHHKFSRNKSYVDLRSQMLHQKLVEEVNKRMYKTIGSVENIGFQSPYNAPREGKEPSNFHGIPMKNSGFTWGSS